MPVLPTTWDPAHAGTHVVLSSGNLNAQPASSQNSVRATNKWTIGGTKTVQWEYIYTAVDLQCVPSVGIAIDGETYDGSTICGAASACSLNGWAYGDSGLSSFYAHGGSITGGGVVSSGIGGAAQVGDAISMVLDPVGLTLSIYLSPFRAGVYLAPILIYTITGLTPGAVVYPTIGQGNGGATAQAWHANFGAQPFSSPIGTISFDTAAGVATAAGFFFAPPA